MELSSVNYICKKCGTAYSRSKGYFPINYGELYKGGGCLPYCRDCVDKLFEKYLKEAASSMDAVRQVCRKLDLYWNQALYADVEKRNTTRTIMTSYMQKIAQIKYAGKSYDDTLREENALWTWPNFFKYAEQKAKAEAEAKEEAVSEEEQIEIPEDVRTFWGPGYNEQMYLDLEQRRTYWMGRYPEGTVLEAGEEAILRQICILEIAINKDRAEGKSVDKSVNALNALLGSANMKPAQKKESDTSLEGIPFGVGIAWCEKYRPIPEPDPELADVDNVVRYIEVWLKGHLSKMLGLKNSYSKLYEDEMARLTVERPEYDGEDEETVFNEIFAKEAGEQ